MKTDLIETFVRAAAAAAQELTGSSLSVGRGQTEEGLRARMDLSIAVPVTGNLRGIVLFSLARDTVGELGRILVAAGGPRPEEDASVDPAARSAILELATVMVGRALDRFDRLGVTSSIGTATVLPARDWRADPKIAPQSVVFECQSQAGPIVLALAIDVEDPSAHEKRKERVLIVDHSVFSRRQLAQIVARSGFEVDESAKDGESALAAYEKAKSHFVLADLLELGMNEVQFFDKVLAVNPRAVIFIVSSVRPQHTLEELRRRGVRDFLPKPVDEKDLVRRMQEATVHRYVVDVEDGGLSAFLTIHPARIPIPAPGVADLREALRRRGVVECVDEAALERMVASPIHGERVRVARGVEPGRGTPAQVELYFEEKTHFGHMMKEEGADQNLYDNVRLVHRIEPGEPVAQRFSEPSYGVPGRLVTGREVPGLLGWDPVVPKPGLEVTPDGKMLVATEKGSARLEGENLYLEPLLEIQRSVTRATGDVNFHGSVLVWGDVSGGAAVTATGDVEVKGDVEGGIVRAGRNVLAGRIIGKKGTGSVAAYGHVGCRYVHGAAVGAMGDVYVLGFANQVDVVAGGSFVLLGDQPNLSGGKVYAGELADVGDLGSNRAHETIVEVASETFYERLDDLFLVLRSSFRENPPMAIRKQILADPAFAERIDGVRARMQEVRLRLEEVWKKGETEHHLRVRGTAHPGSLVRIGRVFLDLDERHSSVRFFLRGMSIGISDFSKLKS